MDDTVVVGQTVALLSASAGSEEGTFLAGAAALEAAPTPAPKTSTVHTVQSVMASGRKPMIRFPRRGAASASTRIEPAVVLRPAAAAAAAAAAIQAATAAIAQRSPYVGALVTEHPQRPPLSARELEMIELGGAEP